jgi:methionyl-tRNA formyltransferase
MKVYLRILMRFLFFGDESSIPLAIRNTNGHQCLVVVAHNRAAAISTARGLGIDFLVQPRRTSVESTAFLTQVLQFQPDAIVCSSYGLLIPDEIIRISPLGGVNIHGGLLPEWRGANILNWVLIKGAEVTGVTAHQLTAEFDSGPIISQERVPIMPDDTAVTLRDRLSVTTEMMTNYVFSVLKSGSPPPSTPQDESRARMFPRRSPEDGRIDWSRSDREIYNLIRALVRPWPGAFTLNSDGTKTVFRDFVPIHEIDQLRKRHYVDVDASK